MESTVVVVGDIHGHLYAFETILEEIHHRFENRVFTVLVGDLVDRGHDSAGVVRRVRTAVAEGTMECVLGNHDEMFLQLLLLYRPRLCEDAGVDATVQENLVAHLRFASTRLLRLWLGQGGAETIHSYGGTPSLPETWDIPPEDISFLSNRPLAWRRGAITVTHARGDVTAIRNAVTHRLDPWNVSETDRKSVLWNREPVSSVEDGIHVCGHTPRDAPLVDGLTREIDTGCAYHQMLTAYAPGHDTYLFTSCAPYPDRSSRTTKYG